MNSTELQNSLPRVSSMEEFRSKYFPADMEVGSKRSGVKLAGARMADLALDRIRKVLAGDNAAGVAGVPHA